MLQKYGRASPHPILSGFCGLKATKALV